MRPCDRRFLASLKDAPFLEAVRGSDADGQASSTPLQPPKRFCCIFFPNGVSLPPPGHPAHEQWHWFPHGVGSDYVFTRSLEPLEKHRGELTILSGLSHPAMRKTIAHISADCFLTGADSSRVHTNSISLDQLIATRIGNQTRFPSLSLSSDGGVGAPGRTRTLSFSASGRPVSSLSEPRAIFNRLFGVEDRSLEEQRRMFGRNRSILDNVLAETAALEQNLSADDRRRLDEYTTSVREIEHRLERADQWLDVQRPQVDVADFDLAVTPRDDAEEYIRVIFDLMYVAFLTDSELSRNAVIAVATETAAHATTAEPVRVTLSSYHGARKISLRTTASIKSARPASCFR